MLQLTQIKPQITYLVDHEPVSSRWESLPRPFRGENFVCSHCRMELRSGSVKQWITAIENLLGGGASQLIEHILGTAAYGQWPINIDLGQGPNGPSLGGVVIDPQQEVVLPVGP